MLLAVNIDLKGFVITAALNKKLVGAAVKKNRLFLNKLVVEEYLKSAS